jgi:hypothetical protein
VPALHQLGRFAGHVVAPVVKAKLGVGAKGVPLIRPVMLFMLKPLGNLGVAAYLTTPPPLVEGERLLITVPLV